MKTCLHCNNPIPPNKDIRNKFCSQKCANIVKGINSRKCCTVCGKQTTPSKSGNTRDKCVQCLKDLLIENKKLSDVLGSGANRYNKVRHHARKILTNKKPKACVKCGYDKHVEACHLKPIKDFSLSTLISEVNDISNLEWLCPNHHWELDNS